MERIEMEDMARLLEDVPPSDPELLETCYQEYIEHGYIIYDGKRDKAVCTRCGEEWDIYHGEYAGLHGRTGWCPECGERCMVLSAGRGRQRYTEYFRVLSFAEHQGKIYGFLNEVIADFRPFGRPNLYKSLTNIYIIGREEQTRYRLRDNWYGDGYYEQVKPMHVPAAPHAMGGCWAYYSKYEDHAYTIGLYEMLARSDCRHLLNMPILREFDGMNIIRFLSTCMKYHSVELLGKAGFEHIVRAKIEGDGCRGINWRGKSLEKILKLPRRHVRMLRDYDPTMRELEAFQALSEPEKETVCFPILKDMLCWREYDYKTGKYRNTYRKNVEKFMPFDKWLRWAKTQEHYMSAGRSRIDLLSDYKDYMQACEKLGRDIRKYSVLRPKDLKRAHDEAIEQVKIERNAAIEKAIAENSRTSDFKTKDLMIIPAQSQEDLNKESAKLCHCVKTYGDKIARGTCFIFFVRRTSDPQEPYYTLETRPTGEFVQCRGLHNCSMTDDVEIFTKAFTKKLKAEISKEKKTAKAAAIGGGTQILCPAI